MTAIMTISIKQFSQRGCESVTCNDPPNGSSRVHIEIIKGVTILVFRIYIYTDKPVTKEVH